MYWFLVGNKYRINILLSISLYNIYDFSLVYLVGVLYLCLLWVWPLRIIIEVVCIIRRAWWWCSTCSSWSPCSTSIWLDVLALVQRSLLWLLGHEIGSLLGRIAGRWVIMAIIGDFVRRGGGRWWKRGRWPCGSSIRWSGAFIEDVARSL